ncbi:protein mono-ADP-ribosyltransferase PARP9 isoform X2 [Halichoeres trimaculatus]|uniref:protein mono-ADP-ribosyltransferase PARP9 isoform X2 n=1 Tax=Halichoeres trimaculatus TaxID=147232 RepID=UPI003D9E5526
MPSDPVITLHGHSVDIVRRSREALSDVLQSKFGCEAFIEGVDSQRDLGIAQQGRPTVEDKPRFVDKLQCGVQVSVWKGDLTIFTRAVAVVNAANTHLQHHGGLARALSKAGGPDVRRESDDYISKHGPLKTGDAIVTGPGRLQCRHIIHAVGPDLSPGPSVNEVSKAKPLLEEAIRSILDNVRKHNLQSVAIPAISSGLFHYPLAECANTIVSTVKDYYGIYNPHKHYPKEIFLVNNDEPTVQEMTRACQQILGQQHLMTYSQATANKRRDDMKTSAHSLQFGTVHLKLKKGKIEEQKTDVIVNTTSESLDLKIGKISSALLNKAGYEMQRELFKASKAPQASQASQSRHVFITNGYRLGCKHVFHTFCAVKGSGAAQEKLFMSVLECLRLSVMHGHKSITFPAIGTGALEFSGKEVAEIILHAVSDFAAKSQQMLEVSVVIFPSDIHTFQAFEEQMKFYKERSSGPSFEPFNSTDNFRAAKASSPQITLNGPSEVATHEASQWLQNLLFNSAGTAIICNNFTLHFGEQEYQQLSRLTQNNVHVEEFFDKGRGGIMVKGQLDEEVAVAALQVEAILCKIQKEFVRVEEQEICRILTKNVSFGRKIPPSPQESKDRLSLFQKSWKRIVKVEKVENPGLEEVFEFKKTQLKCSPPRRMFQCIPAQFIEMVCHIGFHAEFAPSQDPEFGEGIYFAGTIEEAMKVWGRSNEKFVYFVEAEVLTGKSIPGKPGLILPPAVGTDPETLCDSVHGGSDISVIFSGYQALPRYIITCEMF